MHWIKYSEKMKRSRIGNHRTNYSGKGDEQTGEFRNYQFGDNLSNISLTESLKNAQINNGIGDFSMSENDLVVEDTNFKAQMSTVLMIDISHSMIFIRRRPHYSGKEGCDGISRINYYQIPERYH